MNEEKKVDDFGFGSKSIIVVVVGIVLLIAMFSGNNDDHYDRIKKDLLKEANESEEKITNDSNVKTFTERPTPFYNKDSFLLENIINFKSKIELLNSSPYNGELSSLTDVTKVFSEGWDLVNQAQKANLDWLTKESSILKKRLQDKQKVFLPKWRKEFVKILKYKLSYENVEVTYSNNTLRLKGYFVTEKEVEASLDALRQFCFPGRIHKAIIDNSYTNYIHPRIYFNGKDTDPY